MIDVLIDLDHRPSTAMPHFLLNTALAIISIILISIEVAIHHTNNESHFDPLFLNKIIINLFCTVMYSR